MTMGASLIPGDDRKTVCQQYDDKGQPCGSGSSDCPSWRITTDQDECGPGLIALSSSYDLNKAREGRVELIFRGHEWAQVFYAWDTKTMPDFLVAAIEADEEVCRQRVIELSAKRDKEGLTELETRELGELAGITPAPEPSPADA